MLLRTLFVLALFALVGETIVHGAAAAAAAALRERAVEAAHAALTGAVRAAASTIAQTIAVDPAASAIPLPSPLATCAASNGAGCALFVRTTFGAAAVPAPAPCAANACTLVLQGNSAVAEGRASVELAVVVSSASGVPIATRGGIVSFRTFGAAPYAAPVGGVDGSVDALMNAGPADDAGSATSSITVEYDGAGGNVPGDVWLPRDERANGAAPAWDR